MIAATYTEGKSFEVLEVPVPDISEREALLRVRASSICGTDVKICRNGHRKLAAGQRIVLGHEFVGTIEKVGSAVRGVEAGMRVGVAPNWGCGRCESCLRGMANMCPEYSAFGIDTDGAHTRYVRLPAAALAQGNLAPIPEGVPWEEASLAEPLSCVINGQRGMKIAPGETVVIYGVGPMGLLHVMLAAASGGAQIVAVDTNAERLVKAREAGATVTVQPGVGASVREQVLSMTGGVGADVAILATPVPEIAEEALSLLAPFGRLSLFASLIGKRPLVPLDANLVHRRNLCVTGTTGGTTSDFRAALRLIAGRRVDVRKVISDVFPLSRVQEAYQLAQSGKCLKVVLVNEE